MRWMHVPYFERKKKTKLPFHQLTFDWSRQKASSLIWASEIKRVTWLNSRLYTIAFGVLQTPWPEREKNPRQSEHGSPKILLLLFNVLPLKRLSNFPNATYTCRVDFYSTRKIVSEMSVEIIQTKNVLIINEKLRLCMSLKLFHPTKVDATCCV